MDFWSQQFQKIAKRQYFIGALLLFIIGNVLIFSQVARFEEATGGMRLLELPTMVSEDFYAVVNDYGEEGRAIYQWVIQPLDVVYPLTAGFLFAVALAILARALFRADSRWQVVPLLGPLATLTDWLENLGVFLILRTADTPIPILETLAKSLIIVKFAISSLAVLTIVILFLIWMVRWMRR